MKYFTNKKLIAGLIILITAVNLASLGTIIYYTRYAAGDADYPQKDRVLREKQDRYHPDKEARQFFDEARSRFKARVHPHIEQIRKTQSLIMEELLKEDSDTVKLDSLAHASGEIHAQIKKNMTEVFLIMNEKATPHQQQHLERFYRHVMIDSKGPGNRDDKRKFRNRKNNRP
jgi:hypothetical protein